MWPLTIVNLAMGFGMLALIGMVSGSGLPLAWRVVVVLPMFVAISCAVAFVRYPPEAGAGPHALWRFTPLGVKLNPAHPISRRLFKFWAGLGVCWVVALTVALRPAVSRLLGL